jgi:tetratricopeptide (TPR) repeat protein
MYHRALAAMLTWFWAVGNRQGSSTPPDQKEASLRALLRRFPYWAHGHLALAEIAIDAENIALAYSSALSCVVLQGGNSARSREALLIVGQCFLKRGDCERALEYMLQAQELGLQTPRLAEDIAAAHILRGGYAEAYEILRQMPANKITAAGKAALGFARSKTTRPPD